MTNQTPGEQSLDIHVIFHNNYYGGAQYLREALMRKMFRIKASLDIDCTVVIIVEDHVNVKGWGNLPWSLIRHPRENGDFVTD